MLRRLGNALQLLRRCYGVPRPPSACCAGARPKVLYRHAATTVTPTETTSSSIVAQDPPSPDPEPDEDSPIPSFAYHWETTPPSPSQLRIAERFFTRSAPSLLYSTSSFHQVQFSSIPEVAFLGRSNVGKSSLLNALMGSEICRASKKPGRTRTMNFFAVGGGDDDEHMGNRGRLVVLDMPGYGYGSRQQWGQEIMKYLVGRRQLKRVFLLTDPTHGLKPRDHELLHFLREKGISHQIVASKIDRLIPANHAKLIKKPRESSPPLKKNLLLKKYAQRLQNIFTEMRPQIQPRDSEHPVALGELIGCSAYMSVHGGQRQRIGINNLRWAVLVAAGLDSVGRDLGSGGR